MSTREARSRCPHAAFLTGRFHAYRATSAAVMALLRELSPAGRAALARRGLRRPGAGRPARPRRSRRSPRSPSGSSDARARGHRRADRLGRHRHLQVHRQDRQRPRQARRPGRRAARHRAGPAPARCRSPSSPASGRPPPSGCAGSACTPSPSSRQLSEDELVRLLGKAHGTASTSSPARDDDRPVVAGAGDEVGQRRGHLRHRPDRPQPDGGLLDRQAGRGRRAAAQARLSGRTVTIKVRLHDFTTLNRSTTLPAPTDERRDDRPARPGPARGPGHLRRRTPARGRRLRAGRLDPGGPVRRRREDAEDADDRGPDEVRAARVAARRGGWAPGMDVVHEELGRGWVWGSGRVW